MPDIHSVLVVDDADDIRLLVRTVLGRAGWVVSEAARGSAVAAALAGTLPDVVLLDIQMPDQDGWATLADIRREPATRDLPVVLCTVKAGREDRARGWQLGCDGYLTKPFAIESLIDELLAVVRRTPLERLEVRREQLALLTSLEETRS